MLPDGKAGSAMKWKHLLERRKDSSTPQASLRMTKYYKAVTKNGIIKINKHKPVKRQ